MRRLRDSRGRRGTVFADDLLQSRPQYLPWEDLDILFDIPRFWVAEPHNDLEEVLRFRLCLADRQGLESFKVAPNSVFLFHRKPVRCGHKLLEEVYGVDGCDEALVFLLPPDAADTYAVGRSLVHRHGSEGGRQTTAGLRLLEHDDTSSVFPLFRCPTNCHGLQVSLYVQNSFVVRRKGVIGAPKAY